MNNEEDEDIEKIAKVLLSLGHSFLRSLTEDEIKQAEEDEKKQAEEDKKKVREDKNKILVNETVENIKNGVQTEMTEVIEENMQQEKLYGKKSDYNGKKRQEYKDKINNEDKEEKSFKLNKDIELQTEANKNEQNEANKKKYEVEKEAANKFDEDIQPNYETDVQKEFNSEICQKSEVDKENDIEMHVDSKFVQESVEIMQERPQMTEKDSETGLNVDMQSDPMYPNKLDGNLQEELKENQQISENFTEIQLLIQFDKSELQQELGGKVQEEFDIENQLIPGRDIQIKLNIEIEKNSKCQQQLDLKVQEELDQEKQLISEGDQEIDMEITKELDKNKLVESNDKNKKCTTTLTGQNIEGNLQFVINKKLKKDTEKNQLELNNISQEQLDKEIQHEVEQALYHHKIVLGRESQAKRKILEQKLETVHGEILQEIDRLTSDIQNRGLDEEIQQNVAESTKKIQQKINDLKKTIDESQKKYEEELLKEINKTLDKTNVPVAQEKFVENLNLFFENQSAPLINRSEQLYNLIPPKIRESFKVPTENDTDMQQEIDNTLKDLNEEIQDTDDEVNIDVSRVNQQQFNKEIQEVNEEIQANSGIQHKVNIDEKRVAEEDKEFEFYNKKKRANREMQANDNMNVQITNDSRRFFRPKSLKDKIEGKLSDYFHVSIIPEKVVQQTKDGKIQEVMKISEMDYNKKAMEKLLIPKNAPKKIKKALKLQFNNKVEELMGGLVQRLGSNMMSKKFYERSYLKLAEESKAINNEPCNEIRQDFEEDMIIDSEEEVKGKVIKEIQKNVEEQINVVKHFKNNEGEVKEKPVVNNDNSEEETQLQDYGQVQEESDVCVDDFEEEIPVTPLVFDEECLSSEEELRVGVNEVNVVEEIVEDSTKYIPPVSNSIPSDEESSSTEESLSTDESSSTEESSSRDESSSTEESTSTEEYNPIENQLRSTEEGYKSYGITQQFNDEQDLNKRLQNLKKEKENVCGKKFDKKQKLDYDRKEKLKAFKMHNDLMADMFYELLEGKQDLDKKLQDPNKQKKNYSEKKIDKKHKLDHSREEKLKAFKKHNDFMADMFDEQHQQFYQLKEGLTRCTINIDEFIQSEMFEKLEKEMLEEELLGNENFPEKFDEEPSDPSYLDIRKEVVDLQHEVDELEQVFENDVKHEVDELEQVFENDVNTNIPLEFEEDTLKQPSTPEPYNLFETLYAIHRKKLCEFVDSDEWPYSSLVPSGLLDALFDDPLEFKPNVLVLTLYCAEIGFSIKITKNKNEPPEEIFYCYKKDETLFSFIESEKLPPTLLGLLDQADPNLFYNGCVIVEIHILIDGVPGRMGRILLRACNESILQDTKNLIALIDDGKWTNKMKLRLESKIILLNHPVMCMDILPATGVALNLQHFLLSARKLELNPLKRKYSMYSNLSMKMDLISNDGSKSNSSSEPQTSSDLMDTAIQEVYYVLWKFDYRLPAASFNIFKLYVIISSSNSEFSILLSKNSKYGSTVNFRFKINLQTNEIKTYILEILNFIKLRISPDIVVIRRYKNDDKLPPRCVKCVPALCNDNIFEPCYEDISELINELLSRKCDYECNKTDYSEIKSPIVPINNLSGDTQKTERNLISSKQMDHTINFCNTNNLSRNSCTNIDNMFGLNLRQNKVSISEPKMSDKRYGFHRTGSASSFTNPKAVDSSTLKSPAVPMDILVDHDTIVSPKESSIITETNSDVESSLASQMLVVSLSNTSVNVNQESGSISEIFSTSIAATEILPPISSSLVITSLASDILTIIPSVSSAINVLSSLPRPITVIASVPSRVTVVSSTTSNMSSSEASIKLPSQKEHSVRLDNNLESEHHSPTMYDVMKSDPRTLLTQPLISQYEKNISVVKHVHDNGICIKGFKTEINSKALPLKAVLIQKNSLEEEIIKDHQLDCQKKPEKLYDILNTNVAGPSNMQEVLKNVVPLDQSRGDQVSTDTKHNHDNDNFIPLQTFIDMKPSIVETTPTIINLINENSGQETENQPTSSDVEDCRGIKRKWPTL